MSISIKKMLALTLCTYVGLVQAEDTPFELIPENSAFIQEIDAIVNTTLQEFNVPGAAVSIRFSDEKTFSKGYGKRNIQKNLPVTEQTLFPIASCTKAFTALMIGQLVEEKKLNWDDLVTKYIPEFSLPLITIRDLLAHRTGYGRHDPIWFFTNVVRQDIVGISQFLPSTYALREKYIYSNYMYTIALTIIERVTEESWEEGVSSRILRPLKMTSTNSSICELKASSDYATPYSEVQGNLITVPFRNPYVINAGGGLNSNAKDMATWLSLQLSDGRYSRVIHRDTLTETHTAQMSIVPPLVSYDTIYQDAYGLGWFIGNYKNYPLLNHLGELDGYSTEVTLLPQEEIGIVVMTNSSSAGRYAISCIRNKILDKLLNLPNYDWVTQVKATHTAIKGYLNSILTAYEQNRQYVDDATLAQYDGTYYHPGYGNLEVKADHGFLVAQYGDQTIPLYFKANNVYTGKILALLYYGAPPLLDFVFVKDSLGNATGVNVPFEVFRGMAPISFVKVN